MSGATATLWSPLLVSFFTEKARMFVDIFSFQHNCHSMFFLYRSNQDGSCNIANICKQRCWLRWMTCYPAENLTLWFICARMSTDNILRLNQNRFTYRSNFVGDHSFWVAECTAEYEFQACTINTFTVSRLWVRDIYLNWWSVMVRYVYTTSHACYSTYTQRRNTYSVKHIAAQQRV